MTHMSETVIDGLTVVDCNGVPMMRAIELGERLELTRPANIINLVRRQQKLGKLSDFDTLFVTKQRVNDLGVEQSYVDVYLSETGAVIVTLACRTKTAVAICRAVVAVFIAWRHGRLGGTVDTGAIAKALDAQSIALRDVIARQDSAHGTLVTLQAELVRLHREASDDRVFMRAELMRAHEKMWDANANAHAAMLKASDDRGRELREGHDRLINADRELWKEMKAGRDSVDKTFAGYDSLARRLGWHEENAPIDGVITAKQYCELQAGIKRIVDMEVLAGKKSAGVIRRSVYNELGEIVRWGGNAQPWRMLPAQRISDARTYLRRRYKLALDAVPVDKRNGATQGDLFEAFVRATTPPKETKH